MNIYQHAFILSIAIVALIVAISVDDHSRPVIHSIAYTLLLVIITGYSVTGFILAFNFLGSL